ncbi:L,D-transpeptidase [Gillisia sp. M10.2A]|uniref:L,D-transpeptidase n=1 Tax=Gillisia lutea TaxID=2909668 RepID=A0ABS9EGA5_9FLAO|nr:L,D-transpeptidase [Gillisia lutea]MCF4101287.1 L,D-transpeptidase [Gillisia lutea]
MKTTTFLSKYKNASIYLVIFMVLFSCEKKSPEAEVITPKASQKDTVSAKKVNKKPKLIVNYKLDSLSNKAAIDSFQNSYTDNQKKLIFALNRMDSKRLRIGSPVVIPDTLDLDLIKYSPFPEKLSILDSLPKTLLISQRVQGFALYERGKLVKWGPVSSGKKSTPTPNGLHYANYKAKKKVSTVNDSWLLPYYFNFMNFEGVGVHQYSLPGYPASHACVRLYMEDAQYIYDWATQWELSGHAITKNGTPFMVFGEYDYKNPYPWRQLATNADSNNISEEEIETLKSYVAKYNEDPNNKVEDLIEEDELSLIQ